MLWDLHIADPAEKELDRAPRKDRERILAVLQGMRENPFRGDIVRLKGLPAGWRRRVGDWRILYRLEMDRRLIVVTAVRRRTSTTYRRT